MTDIHALIAAAKRWGGSAETAPDKARDTLRQHAIAMAEALVKIAEPLPWPANSDALRLSDIARECLNRTVKELMP